MSEYEVHRVYNNKSGWRYIVRAESEYGILDWSMTKRGARRLARKLKKEKEGQRFVKVWSTKDDS